MLKTLFIKLYAKIKPHLSTIFIGLGALLLGLLSNRQRLSSRNDSFERVSGTVDDIKDGNRDTADTIDNLDSVNSDIKNTNVGAGTSIDAAISGIGRAKEILSNAKHT